MIGNALSNIVAHRAAPERVHGHQRPAWCFEQAFQCVGKRTPHQIIHDVSAEIRFFHKLGETFMMQLQPRIRSKLRPAHRQQTVSVVADRTIAKAQLALRIVAADHR